MGGKEIKDFSTAFILKEVAIMVAPQIGSISVK